MAGPTDAIHDAACDDFPTNPAIVRIMRPARLPTCLHVSGPTGRIWAAGPGRGWCSNPSRPSRWNRDRLLRRSRLVVPDSEQPSGSSAIAVSADQPSANRTRSQHTTRADEATSETSELKIWRESELLLRAYVAERP